MSSPYPEFCLEVRSCEELALIAAAAHGNGYSLCAAPILRCGAIPVHDQDAPPPASFPPGSLVVAGPEYARLTIGAFAPWVDLDSKDPTIAAFSQILFRQQAHWSTHIGLHTAMFHCPDHGPIVSFARAVNESLSILTYSQTVIRIQLTNRNTNTDINTSANATWNQWNLIRNITRHHQKLVVALEIGFDLPDDDVLDRWLAEPVKMVVIPTSTFLANKKGYPAMTKRHQSFIQRLMQMAGPRFVISSESFESAHPSGTLASYREYISHLNQTLPELDEISRFSTSYNDHLQAPLQPLMDNLDSETYEVFEKDPVKYHEYERAMREALLDRVADHSDVVTVMMVVGAGRGPLVDRALSAADDTGRKVKIYAIEKNANAVVGLRSRKESVWGQRVTVVHVDMRYWDSDEKADILISELLGSFGDNELSPECLDGAQRLLKPDGISIPSQYTTYISPLSSSSIYKQAAAHNDIEHMETPYVVKFHSVREIDAPVPIWTFDHPIPAAVMMPPGHPHFNQHNTRHGVGSFTVSQDTIMHGIAGYFEAVLYKHIMISIHPRTHSKGMFSWFPIFFPLRVPVYLPKGSSVDVHMWRVTDTRKVWYEWNVVPVIHGTMVVGEASLLHNVGGQSYWIGL